MIEPYKIESESEADTYLNALLAKQEYCFMHEVEQRATQFIKDGKLRTYFINKAREILKV